MMSIRFVNRIGVSGIFLATCFVIFFAAENTDLMADERSEIVDRLFRRWDRPESPGGSVAVVQDGKLLYSKGFGMANLEHNISITPDSIFHVASVSKQFTAFAILILQQDGKLKLEDSLHKHIPELHDFGHSITIRHLLHHTSGLRDQWDLLVLAGWRMEDVITHDDVLELVKAQRELNFVPGDKYLYCNTGYTLLAEIVYRVSGRTLKEFCQERIFEPLKMKDTHFHDDHRHIVPNRTECYRRRLRGWQKSVLSYAIVGATSLFTTANDMAKWQTNFETMELGNKAIFEEFFTTGILNSGTKIQYAAGIYFGNLNGIETVGHSGGDAGFRCKVIRIPTKKLSVIVLSNAANMPVDQIAGKIAIQYIDDSSGPNTSQLRKQIPSKEMGKPGPASKRVGYGKPFEPKTASPLNRTAQDQEVKTSDFSGRYYCPELEVSYDFVESEKGLVLKRRKFGSVQCGLIGDDMFRVVSGAVLTLKFQRDPKTGKVNSVLISTGRVKNLSFLKNE